VVANRSLIRAPYGVHALSRRSHGTPLAASGVGGIDLGLAELFRHSPANHPPLRVGVLLDGPWTIRCFRHVLEDLRACDFARLAAVVYNDDASGAGAPARSRVRRYVDALANPATRRTLAYAVYSRFLDASAQPEADPLGIVGLDDLLDGVPALRVRPLASRFVHRFPPAAVDAVRALDLDVLVRFGFNILRGEILTVPRYGVWSWHHGDPDAYRGGPAHYWEMVESNPVSGAMLQVLTEELDGGLVLCKAQFPTTRTLSVAENRHGPYWGSQHFLIQKLCELHRYGWEFLLERAPPPAPYRGARRPYRSPTNVEFAGWTAGQLARRLVRRVGRRETDTDWNVGLRRSSTPLPFDARHDAPRSFALLENPRGRFLADPFLLERDGDTWLFVEDYAFDTRRGVISCGRVTPDGRVEDLRACLDVPYHLSYPHVFEHDGEVWMTPESEASATVDLYRAVAFPHRWARVGTLLPLRAVDPTPFLRDGRWWMFVTHTAVPGQGVNTLLFEAPALTGPWRLHRASPVSSDVRRSRSAGAVLDLDGRRLRPAQDGSVRYGRAIVWNEITRLGPTDYAERPLRRLDAGALPAFDGLHHWHRASDWEVVDVRRQSPIRRFDETPYRDAHGTFVPIEVRSRPVDG
jgi:hypothetical protein